MPNFRVGLNPLPWVLTAGFESSVPVLRSAFAEIQQTPFRAIHADPPSMLDGAGYLDLLHDFGLSPAPGYFGALFEAENRAELLEAAKRHAATQARIGNTEVFLAGKAHPARRATPAVGAAFDAAVLERVIDGLGAAAEVVTAEGVRPAIHPHVGTAIETEHEVEAVLDAIPSSILGFGPDTGHLRWAGMDPATIMSRHADRIAAVHLKDVHLDHAAAARAAGADYAASIRGPHPLWTEPGRGDVNLVAALQALPSDFDGWVVVEVDVPQAPSNAESSRISAQWVTDHYGTEIFGGRG